MVFLQEDGAFFAFGAVSVAFFVLSMWLSFTLLLMLNKRFMQIYNKFKIKKHVVKK